MSAHSLPAVVPAWHLPAATVPLPAALLPTARERWVRRVASAVTRPLTEEGDDAHAIRNSPLWVNPPLDAGGLPVLLVGGMASTSQSWRPMFDWLERLNCRPVISPVAFGIDCGERTVARVAAALRTVAESTGRPVAVLAHSRGGQFARTIAVRHPELVEGLVTLGSPVNRMLGVHPLLKATAWMIGLAGSVGVPGLARVACLLGECCRRLRSDLLAPFPTDVPFVSVYSRADRFVDWRSCLDPEARHREVVTTHSGLVYSPPALELVADELARLVALGTSGAEARGAAA